MSGSVGRWIGGLFLNSEKRIEGKLHAFLMRYKTGLNIFNSVSNQNNIWMFNIVVDFNSVFNPLFNSVFNPLFCGAGRAVTYYIAVYIICIQRWA